MINGDQKRWAAYAETAMIVVGLVGLGVTVPHHIIGDSVWRFRALTELAHTGRLNDDIHPILSHLLSLPAYFLSNPTPVVKQYNLVLFALAIGWTYWLLRNHVDRALLRRFFLVLIIASALTAHIIQYNSEPFTALAVAVGLAAVVMRQRLGWTAVAFGAAATPAAIGGLGLVVLARIWKDRRLRYVLVGVAAVGLVGLENWVRRGSPFNVGYDFDVSGVKRILPTSGKGGFSYPFLFGLASIMLSFGKGLVFFAPGILLPVRSLLRKAGLWDVYLLWMLFLAGLVVVYSRWWAWEGGWTYGPRFFAFAGIPASLAIAALLWKPSEKLWLNLFVLGAWVLSLWVGICGTVYFGVRDAAACVADNHRLEALCSYTPDFSVLGNPLVQFTWVRWPTHLWILFSAIVFAYLSMPLIYKTLSQLNVVLARVLRSAASRRWSL